MGRLFGTLFILAGLAAGVILVTQPQLLKERAASIGVSYTLPTSTPTPVCDLTKCSGATQIISSCNDSGQMCIGGQGYFDCPASYSTCEWSFYTKTCNTSGCNFYHSATQPCFASSKCTGKTNICDYDWQCKLIERNTRAWCDLTGYNGGDGRHVCRAPD